MSDNLHPLSPRSARNSQSKKRNAERRAARRAASEERKAAWDALTINQKLRVLSKRPGEAKKQRAKLQALKKAQKAAA